MNEELENKIKEKDIDYICKAIENEEVVHLNMSGKNISTEEATKILKVVEKNKTIKTLNLENNEITEGKKLIIIKRDLSNIISTL
jgi:23S rRNA pseudoU1915 N3-methylase RlmH